MTHKQMVADYREALAGRIKMANGIMEKIAAEDTVACEEWSTWWGVKDGLERALTLTNILSGICPA